VQTVQGLKVGVWRCLVYLCWRREEEWDLRSLEGLKAGLWCFLLLVLVLVLVLFFFI
jgi:hypothetical protein